jgi:hypothetical protein
MNPSFSPRSNSLLRSGHSTVGQPLLDEPEVVRSPHATSGRIAATFSQDPANAGEPSARLRPKLTNMPTSPLAPTASMQSNPACALSHLDSRSYYPNPGLSIRTIRSEAPTRLLGSPQNDWRCRSNNFLVRKLIIVVCVLTFASTALLVRRLLISPERTLEHTMQACEPRYQTIEPHHHSPDERVHGDPSEIPVRDRIAIAMVTLHDSRKTPMPKELAYMTGIDAGRDVDILEVVWKNRRDYAERHGYTLIDGTVHRGPERPPAWYKIKAVEAVLDEYDWVFYLDADAWITNPDIKLESILPARSTSDFVVTNDVTGLNAGTWLIRNSDWSRSFLKEWWSMSSYIRVRPGSLACRVEWLPSAVLTWPRCMGYHLAVVQHWKEWHCVPLHVSWSVLFLVLGDGAFRASVGCNDAYTAHLYQAPRVGCKSTSMSECWTPHLENRPKK